MLCTLCNAVKALSLTGRTATVGLASSVRTYSVSNAHSSARGLLSAVQSSSSRTHGGLQLATSSLAPLSRLLSTSASLNKSEDWKAMLRSMPKREEGTEGERDLDFDPFTQNAAVEYPDEDTPNRLFNGVPFSQLPILCIRTSKNNTHLILADSNHTVMWRRSCGQEGFKNCRKGTNVAAQTTAISLAKKAQELGVRQVRVKLRGFAPGRLAAVKGLQLAGLDVVSVTDVTYINWRNVPRPRKQKRL